MFVSPLCHVKHFVTVCFKKCYINKMYHYYYYCHCNIGFQYYCIIKSGASLFIADILLIIII